MMHSNVIYRHFFWSYLCICCSLWIGKASSKSWFWDTVNSLVEKGVGVGGIPGITEGRGMVRRGGKQINKGCISNSVTTMGNWSSVPLGDNVKHNYPNRSPGGWGYLFPVLRLLCIRGLLPGKIMILGYLQLILHSGQARLPGKENPSLCPHNYKHGR